jgi:hypothetical protein
MHKAQARWEVLKLTSTVRAAIRWLDSWVFSKVKVVMPEDGASTASRISLLEGRVDIARVLLDSNRVPNRISRDSFIKVTQDSLCITHLLVWVKLEVRMCMPIVVNTLLKIWCTILVLLQI